VDTDGDGDADITFLLAGLVTEDQLTMTDFVFV
jgi:hypothetical protein